MFPFHLADSVAVENHQANFEGNFAHWSSREVRFAEIDKICRIDISDCFTQLNPNKPADESLGKPDTQNPEGIGPMKLANAKPCSIQLDWRETLLAAFELGVPSVFNLEWLFDKAERGAWRKTL